MELKVIAAAIEPGQLRGSIAEFCALNEVSRKTFYKWRAKFGGMDVSDARKLRELESENAKLKKLLAEAHLDIHALKSVFGVKR